MKVLIMISSWMNMTLMDFLMCFLVILWEIWEKQCSLQQEWEKIKIIRKGKGDVDKLDFQEWIILRCFLNLLTLSLNKNQRNLIIIKRKQIGILKRKKRYLMQELWTKSKCHKQIKMRGIGKQILIMERIKIKKGEKNSGKIIVMRRMMMRMKNSLIMYLMWTRMARKRIASTNL
jgi:hypothetical protein